MTYGPRRSSWAICSSTPTSQGCILWTGATHTDGYGFVWTVYPARLAHRVAWERVYGPIPKGMVIHHKCGEKLCINVDHLEMLERSEHAMLHGGRPPLLHKKEPTPSIIPNPDDRQI